MSIWFSADYHFSHYNIIGYDNRPFKTCEEMNDEIIIRHNSLVKPEDTFYFLGDFMFDDHRKFHSFFQRLNGEKHIIWGNHDRGAFRKKTAQFWQSTQHYYELKYNGRLFVLCHYPMLEWKNSYHGSIHLHGHCHGNRPRERNNRIDVGCMNYDYYPVSIDSILVDVSNFGKLK